MFHFRSYLCNHNYDSIPRYNQTNWFYNVSSYSPRALLYNSYDDYNAGN